MSTFDFDSDTIAANYDDILVPIMFAPWAKALLDRIPHWEGKTVLDLATGTGVVAHLLGDRVTSAGSIIAADINPAMLAVAQRRCADSKAPISFVTSPAHPLDLPDQSVDVVVCQQGFQFFPDKSAAVKEMYRVLRNGGQVIVSTWRPVAECDFAAAICDSLDHIDEPNIAAMMRIPFMCLPDTELTGAFQAAGFENVATDKHSMEFVVEGGIERLVEAVYATPIAPDLQKLTDEKQRVFQDRLKARFTVLCGDGNTVGKMASNLLTACK